MTAPGRVDWTLARERLARAAQALDAAAHAVPVDAERLLAERALALAQPPPEDDDGDAIELLTFRASGVRYALHARHVIEVIPLVAPVRVPGTPPFMVGIVNHRGAILPVIDIGALLTPGSAAGAQRDAIAVAAGDLRFGIASAGVDGIVSRSEGDGVSVLDVDALASDGRLVVDDRDGDRTEQGQER
jgi:chemotaxis signal transduction protein